MHSLVDPYREQATCSACRSHTRTLSLALTGCCPCASRCALLLMCGWILLPLLGPRRDKQVDSQLSGQRVDSKRIIVRWMAPHTRVWQAIRSWSRCWRVPRAREFAWSNDGGGQTYWRERETYMHQSAIDCSSKTQTTVECSLRRHAIH